MTSLQGKLARLRPATDADIPELVRIRATPDVHAWWGGSGDLVAEVASDLRDPDATGYAIELDGRLAGWIQWSGENDPDYRRASIDIYLDPGVRGQGVGTDAVRTLARHLFTEHGHHRITIDPAVENEAAIRSYTKVGFRPVGVMRQYERGPDGVWHDNLLMDLLADELQDAP